MEINGALAALAALAQETRLSAFRLLVRAGDVGMAAGDMARELRVPANTLSTHLSVLSQAGLVIRRRCGRRVIYTADYEGMRRLLAFLVEDCCRGDARACGQLLDALLPAACA